MFQLCAACQPVIERFVQIHNHDHACFDCNTEQSNVTNPDGHAEVVPKQPLQDQSTSHRVQGRKDEDGGLQGGVKHHVQQQKDHEEYDRQNEFQPFFSTHFEFVFSRPSERIAGRQFQVFA